MEQSLSKSVSEELVRPGKDAVTEVITGSKYGEDVGYCYWWAVKTMGGKSYKINKEQMEALMMAAEKAKFVGLDNDMVAVHQITGIELEKSPFGPRSGGAE